MKFFFRVVTKTTAFASVVANRSRLRGALILALAGLACVGCVGRKQYAINEAILISERRQLEDEIYRLQFELRDALEENERLRQELGGDAASGANSSASRTRAGAGTEAGTNAAFFPGLDAAQTPLRTTGAAPRVQTTSATERSVRPTPAPQSADAAPATGEAVETLPDYVPIPVTSAQPGAARRQNVQNATAANVGKTLGVRREVNGGRVASVAASTAPETRGGSVVSSVFVESQADQKQTTVAAPRSTNAAAWSPLAQ